MDQSALVDVQIQDGQRLINRLIEKEWAPTEAAWVKESEAGEWFLYLATPRVGEDGATRPAYRRLIALISDMQSEGFWIDPLSIKLISTDDPIARAVAAVRRRYPTMTATWFHGKRLADLSIDEAYLYAPLRMVVGATKSP